MPSSPRPAAKADAQLLATLDRAFKHHAGKDARIDLPELQRALGLRSEYLATRVMRWFDTNGDGSVDRDEFLAGVRALVFGSDRDKLRFAFALHDHDGDGFVDRAELLRMIAISMAENDVMERPSQPAEHLAATLLSLADKDKDGKISFDEFEALMQKRPTLLRQMTRSEAIWIAPNEDLLAWVDERAAQASAFTRLRERGWAARLVLALWIVANVALFTHALARAALGTGHPNAAMEIGRALSWCLDFNGALILIPMMRRLLSWLRPTWLGRAIPVDDAIAFHRLVGHTLFALAVAHGAAFVVAFASGHAKSGVLRLFETERGASGALLLGVFAVMWVFSLAFIRRTRHFELFYFTHLLYVAWFVLAIAHAPTFLMWAGVPILGFAFEQVLRLARRGARAEVVSSAALRSGVTRLELARPKGLDFSAGDYAFLRIPHVAKHEWHPFTISSAPERDTLTFHVRSLGNWTSALRRRVEEQPDASDLVAYVDGPYGSPSAHIFRSTVAVLIGAGIGVTPFASVLESIILRSNGKSTRPSKLGKVYFFWLNKDQYSFEWFAELLRNLEASDVIGLLDIHLCMTSARAGGTAVGLELARAMMHASGRSDLITGLRTHTHAGAPDWEKMLGEIVQRHAPTKVDVFFCGPPGLAAKLRPLCERIGTSFREEKF